MNNWMTLAAKILILSKQQSKANYSTIKLIIQNYELSCLISGALQAYSIEFNKHVV